MDRKGQTQKVKSKPQHGGDSHREEHEGRGHSANAGRTGIHAKGIESANGKSAGSISKSIHKSKTTLPVPTRNERPSKHETSGHTGDKAGETSGLAKDNQRARHEPTGVDRKAEKAKVQAKVREVKGSSDSGIGITLTKRDPSKYKVMFDRLAQLEKKDSHVKEVKPTAEKPHPAPVVKSPKEAPKKAEPKPAPIARVVTKKENIQKVKERVRVKAVKPTASKAKPTKVTKPKVTGKKLSIPKSRQATPKRAPKSASSARSESSDRENDSAKSIEVRRTIQKSQPGSKKRSLDPRDAIPKFEKFHRKPRAHADEDEPVRAPEPKVRVQKPRPQKPATTVVETMVEEPVEERRSPQKHFTTPAILETPQQTTSKKQAPEKKQQKTVSQKKDDILDDLLLDEMLVSSSKNVKVQPAQPAESHQLNMLTAMSPSPQVEAVEEEPATHDLDALQEQLMEVSSPKRAQGSTKKPSQPKSQAKNESSARTIESKQKSSVAESKQKSPVPIQEESIHSATTPEKVASPVKQPYTFTGGNDDIDMLNEMIQAKPATQSTAKKSYDRGSANKSESKKGSARQVEPASFGLLTGGFGADDHHDEVEEVAQSSSKKDISAHSGDEEEEEVERESAEEHEHDEGEAAEENEPMDEEAVAEERVEESISSGRVSPAKPVPYQETTQPATSLFGNPAGMFSHPTGSLFALADDTQPAEDTKSPEENRTDLTPAVPDQIDNELDEKSEGQEQRSESSMESRHKDSSASSSRQDNQVSDNAHNQSEEREGRQGSQSREGGKLVLEPLNQDTDTSAMLLSNQVRNFENENAHMTLETTNLNRSRTDTPDKAFHDDPQKQNSNSKANDGTDFSFY